MTTAMVSAPISRAISPISGAAPVPVPPPMPAVMKTRSAPSSAASNFVAALLERRPADLGTRAGAQPTGQLPPDLDLRAALAVLERLRIGIDRDELDPLEVLVDHPIHRIPATAAHTDHLHQRVLSHRLVELEEEARPNPQTSSVSVEYECCYAQGLAPCDSRRIAARCQRARDPPSRGPGGSGSGGQYSWSPSTRASRSTPAKSSANCSVRLSSSQRTAPSSSGHRSARRRSRIRSRLPTERHRRSPAPSTIRRGR